MVAAHSIIHARTCDSSNKKYGYNLDFVSISKVKMLSVAPMIGWTDKNYRYLIRHLTRETLLYTEMVMDSAITHNLGSLENFIGCSPVEDPVALQLGGSNPSSLGVFILYIWCGISGYNLI